VTWEEAVSFLFFSSAGEMAEAAAAAVLLVALTSMQLKEVGGGAGQHMLFVAGVCVCVCVCAMGLMKRGRGKGIDCSGENTHGQHLVSRMMLMLANDHRAEEEASQAPLDVTLEPLSLSLCRAPLWLLRRQKRKQEHYARDSSNRICVRTPTAVLTSAVRHIQRVRGHIPTWFQRLAPRGDVTCDTKT
jgi:hypothetical protein